MERALEKTFALGGEQQVQRIGYGVMRLTGQPGNFGPYADWEQGKALLRRAVELGVQLFDSAFAYGPQWADKILAEALHPYPDDLLIATKGGVDKPAPGKIVVDGSPETLRKQDRSGTSQFAGRADRSFSASSRRSSRANRRIGRCSRSSTADRKNSFRGALERRSPTA